MAPSKGIGLRPPHYEKVLRGEAQLDWFEIISENFIDSGGRPLHIVERVRQDYPLGLHGVSLNIGSTDALNRPYLKKLKILVERLNPSIVSDHLCWGGIKGRNWHDLLPLPMTEKFVRHISEKILKVQDFLGRRIALENISTYLRFREDEMSEWDFVSEIARRSDSLILLDINNIYVNSFNHRFDPQEYIRRIPAGRVVQYHLAGHTDLKDFLFDTHDQNICESVWQLWDYAIQKIGHRPFIIERDENIPELSELEAEAEKAFEVYNRYQVKEAPHETPYRASA